MPGSAGPLKTTASAPLEATFFASEVNSDGALTASRSRAEHRDPGAFGIAHDELGERRVEGIFAAQRVDPPHALPAQERHLRRRLDGVARDRAGRT